MRQLATTADRSRASSGSSFIIGPRRGRRRRADDGVVAFDSAVVGHPPRPYRTPAAGRTGRPGGEARSAAEASPHPATVPQAVSALVGGHAEFDEKGLL